MTNPCRLLRRARRPVRAGVDKVRFVRGVAAVARWTATRGRRGGLIDVEYERCPSSPTLRGDEAGRAKLHDPCGNLAFEKTLSFGDVAGDFAPPTGDPPHAPGIGQRQRSRPPAPVSLRPDHPADGGLVQHNMINFVGC